MCFGIRRIAQSKATMACLFWAALASGACAAESACFNNAQMQADTGLRYGARLRITGLTCNSFKQYQLFETNNQSRILTQIDIMQAGENEEALDRYDEYETGLQNAESLEAAKLGSAVYCRRNQPLLDEAELGSAVEIDRAISNYAMISPGSIRACH